jgi:hypothetical protein
MGPAWAHAAPPQAEGHAVSPLTVFPPTPAPKIVSSYPAEGRAVAAGVLVLKVTFDQSMLDLAFELGPAAGGDLPDCLKTPRLLADGRTFVLLCTVETDKTYALAFNPSGQGGFANAQEHRAEPATLTFRTTGEVGATDIEAALKAANLTSSDMPIQEDPSHPGRRAEPG